jgi:hypothetical protein
MIEFPKKILVFLLAINYSFGIEMSKYKSQLSLPTGLTKILKTAAIGVLMFQKDVMGNSRFSQESQDSLMDNDPLDWPTPRILMYSGDGDTTDNSTLIDDDDFFGSSMGSNDNLLDSSLDSDDDFFDNFSTVRSLQSKEKAPSSTTSTRSNLLVDVLSKIIRDLFGKRPSTQSFQSPSSFIKKLVLEPEAQNICYNYYKNQGFDEQYDLCVSLCKNFKEKESVDACLIKAGLTPDLTLETNSLYKMGISPQNVVLYVNNIETGQQILNLPSIILSTNPKPDAIFLERPLCFSNLNTGIREGNSLEELFCDNSHVLLDDRCIEKLSSSPEYRAQLNGLESYDKLKSLIKKTPECVNAQLAIIENNQVKVYSFQPHIQSLKVEAENGLTTFPYNYKVSFGPLDNKKTGILDFKMDNTKSPFNLEINNGTDPLNLVFHNDILKINAPYCDNGEFFHVNNKFEETVASVCKTEKGISLNHKYDNILIVERNKFTNSYKNAIGFVDNHFRFFYDKNKIVTYLEKSNHHLVLKFQELMGPGYGSSTLRICALEKDQSFQLLLETISKTIDDKQDCLDLNFKLNALSMVREFFQFKSIENPKIFFAIESEILKPYYTPGNYSINLLDILNREMVDDLLVKIQEYESFGRLLQNADTGVLQYFSTVTAQNTDFVVFSVLNLIAIGSILLINVPKLKSSFCIFLNTLRPFNDGNFTRLKKAVIEDKYFSRSFIVIKNLLQFFTLGAAISNFLQHHNHGKGLFNSDILTALISLTAASLFSELIIGTQKAFSCYKKQYGLPINYCALEKFIYGLACDLDKTQFQNNTSFIYCAINVSINQFKCGVNGRSSNVKALNRLFFTMDTIREKCGQNNLPKHDLGVLIENLLKCFCHFFVQTEFAAKATKQLIADPSPEKTPVVTEKKKEDDKAEEVANPDVIKQKTEDDTMSTKTVDLLISKDGKPIEQSRLNKLRDSLMACTKMCKRNGTTSKVDESSQPADEKSNLNKIKDSLSGCMNMCKRTQKGDKLSVDEVKQKDLKNTDGVIEEEQEGGDQKKMITQEKAIVQPTETPKTEVIDSTVTPNQRPLIKEIKQKVEVGEIHESRLKAFGKVVGVYLKKLFQRSDVVQSIPKSIASAEDFSLETVTNNFKNKIQDSKEKENVLNNILFLVFLHLYHNDFDKLMDFLENKNSLLDQIDNIINNCIRDNTDIDVNTIKTFIHGKLEEFFKANFVINNYYNLFELFSNGVFQSSILTMFSIAY